ncbi:MAG: hypothetical protein HOH39_04835 [Gammaproteobacteria bacterium]|nr:hypothetical protein [Gammaproteobacteria bacterium]
METSLEVLNKTQRVTPPDALYNKIMQSISDKADIKLIYASVICIALLITINLFSFRSYNDNEFSANNKYYLDSPINYLVYEY